MESTTSPEFPITSSLPRSLAMHLSSAYHWILDRCASRKPMHSFGGILRQTLSQPLIAAQPASFEQVRQRQA